MRTLWEIVLIDVRFVVETLKRWFDEGLKSLGVNSGWTGLVAV